LVSFSWSKVFISSDNPATSLLDNQLLLITPYKDNEAS